ncbi:hypothetical protein [Cohnella fermenti]|uniref:Uncharacterized protein n=1 Tax=Cohnella fermenti TaxID=2565925 RepID=A0A4S4BVA2_9BACL|nr:hypothetical protein [Cohnella fermenti]THF78350.1 hypothetical protein E6C55_14115 [Cohnella fermenti]
MRNRSSAPNRDEDWLKRGSRILLRTAAWLAVALLVAQIALRLPLLRHHLTNTDEWEGIPYVSSRSVR